jgi:predicted DNA-binding transcriptional regulator YafY
VAVDTAGGRNEENGMNAILRRAMQDSDNFVVELDYVDAKGKTTRRVISPIRFLPGNRLLALCLCREAPRQFHLNRCSNVRLSRAEQFMMPVAMAAV